MSRRKESHYHHPEIYPEGKITDDEDQLLKIQIMDSLKIVGIGIPFILIPGASVLMPILIRVADKHHIELMPSAFNRQTK